MVLSCQVEPDRLGVYSQPQFSTGVPVAALTTLNRRLFRPPSALSYPRFRLPDRDLRLGTKVGSVVLPLWPCFVLLAAGALSNPLFAGLVSRAACLLRSFLTGSTWPMAPPFAIIYLIIGIYCY